MYICTYESRRLRDGRARAEKRGGGVGKRKGVLGEARIEHKDSVDSDKMSNNRLESDSACPNTPRTRGCVESDKR